MAKTYIGRVTSKLKYKVPEKKRFNKLAMKAKKQAHPKGSSLGPLSDKAHKKAIKGMRKSRGF